MSSSSDEDSIISGKQDGPYIIIEFTKRGPKSSKPVDIVLNKWIRFDNKKKRFITKFMPGPYNDEDAGLLKDLLINNADAPEGWPEYNCYVRGESDSYDEALIKIDILNEKENAFSSDSNVDSQTKALTFEHRLKKQMLQQKMDSVETKIIGQQSISNVVGLNASKKNVKPQMKRTASNDPSENGGNNNYNDVQSPKKLKITPVAVDSNLNNSAVPMEINDTKFHMILMRLDRLESMMKVMSEKIIQIDTRIQCQGDNVSTEIKRNNFATKYNIELPCKISDDLKKLEAALQINDCAEELENLLKSCVKRLTSITRTTAHLLKLLVSRDMALTFTAQKEVKNKIVIKNMNFTKVLKSTLIATTAIVSDNEALVAIGSALGNAKDWDNNRKTR
ncbi:uncharacterized protein LOC130673881 [Microplitis mediator]|uniref:uncharacterized protein LOC130673881 n=1 Tax=Microplitis mediator TaxID=375433 RepID=UPI00255514A8|nr:uncharacterized protein LOC130673881 [Microplitis mediator]